MASLNQIVFNLAEQAGDATNTILQERLKFMVEYYRALFIRRDAERNFGILDRVSQTFTYDMESVDNVTICGRTLPYTVYRTTEDVPAPVNLRGQVGFMYVGKLDGQEGFQFVQEEQAGYSLFGKFTSAFPKYFYKDKRIYVVASTESTIQVRMVCEAPVTGGIAGGGGVTCLSPDAEYPIAQDMIQRITESIMKNELQLQRPGDDEQIEIK